LVLNILYHHRTRGSDVEKVHILGMVDALNRLGHEVMVVSPPGVQLKRASATSAKHSRWFRRFTCYVPEILFEGLEMLYNLTAYPRIKRAALEQNADVIYERYALFCFAGVAMARCLKIPIILEINDATFLNRVRKLKLNRLARYLERWIFRQADALIAVSHNLKAMLAQHGVKEDKIWVIPNAVDIHQFCFKSDSRPVRKQYHIPDDKIVVGFIGSMVPWHGIDMLLDSLGDMFASNLSIHLLLVGDDRRINLASHPARLKEHVTFTGRIPHDAIPQYIAAMDIAVLPNSNNYGSPMKLFEYMAAGKPVVAPQLGPIEEIITHKVDGYLFEQFNREQMVKFILMLAADKKLRQKIGINAKIKVFGEHTWEKNAQRTLLIYKHVKYAH